MTPALDINQQPRVENREAFSAVDIRATCSDEVLWRVDDALVFAQLPPAATDIQKEYL